MGQIKKSEVLTDKELVLTGLDSDAASGPYLSWMNDAEILRFLEVRNQDRSEELLKKFIEKANASDHDYMFGIFFGGIHVGNIKLTIDPYHKRGSIGLLIGDRSFWGKGIGRRSVTLLARFAFEHLDLIKLTAGCYSNNIGAQKLFEASGFHVEAIRSQHYIENGNVVDAIYLVMFNRNNAEYLHNASK